MAAALMAVACLGAAAWANHDLFEAHAAASMFMASLADGARAGITPAPCPGSGVEREAFRHRTAGTVDWDFGFRQIRMRDGHTRLSRQGYLRDAKAGEERWFKLTLQRDGQGRWCVLALSVDAAARKL